MTAMEHGLLTASGAMKEYLTDDNFFYWIATHFRWWPYPYKKYICSRVSSAIALEASKSLHSHKFS
eukprot:5775382-Heterocapsa_arctica.AAC.1